jgi:Predicted nucleotide-binding protein containing TIR-like domain
MARPKGSKNRNYPPLALEEALEVAQAIQNKASGMQVRRLTLADMMDRSPSSSIFADLVASSRAYGLTTGGGRADQFELTELGQRATSDDEKTQQQAKQEAVLKIEPFEAFLTFFKGKKVPAAGPFKEFLVSKANVPTDRGDDCMQHILADAREVGFIRPMRTGDFIELDGRMPSVTGNGHTGDVERTIEDGEEAEDAVPDPPESSQPNDGQAPDVDVKAPPRDLATNNRVFITHGRNKEIVGQLKDLLTFGGFEPVVSVENETMAKPVPDKVMDDMRSAGAAIIHVGTDKKLLDEEGNEHRTVNPNVLIEIGAAMALYGGRFILLVESGVTLPSNLQGLYEARYEGDKLDYDATMKLLKAFNDFRT